MSATVLAAIGVQPRFNAGGIIYKVIHNTAQAGGVELLSFFERKAAHMFLYFVMALLASFALSLLVRRLSARTGLALLVCAVLASLDEYHQTMVPGRSGEIRDVLVDCSGAAIALALAALPLLAGRKPAAVTAGVLCALPLLPALASPAAAAGFFPFVWAAGRMDLLTPAERAALLASLAPALRGLLFLAACGPLGAFVLWCGLFQRLRIFRVLGSCAAAAVLAGTLAWLAAAALPTAAVGLTVLGVTGAGALWGFSALCEWASSAVFES